MNSYNIDKKSKNIAMNSRARTSIIFVSKLLIFISMNTDLSQIGNLQTNYAPIFWILMFTSQNRNYEYKILINISVLISRTEEKKRILFILTAHLYYTGIFLSIGLNQTSARSIFVRVCQGKSTRYSLNWLGSS